MQSQLHSIGARVETLELDQQEATNSQDRFQQQLKQIETQLDQKLSKEKTERQSAVSEVKNGIAREAHTSQLLRAFVQDMINQSNSSSSKAAKSASEAPNVSNQQLVQLEQRIE